METLQPIQTPNIEEPALIPTLTVEKPKKNILPYILLISILTIILIGMSIWTFMGQNTQVPQKPVVSPPTPTELPFPTSVSTQSPTLVTTTPSIAASASPTETIKPTPKPTLAQNPDGNIFTSGSLDIAFYYAKTMGSDKNTSIKTMETGSKVYIYESSMQPTSGQSIERFDKNSTDTLTQAITKRFLTGIPQSSCFVKLDPKKPSPTVSKATISYPVDDPADPEKTYGETCPEKYKESNGIAYFFEDSDYPDRFYYVSIGQYSIPAYTSKPNSQWQDTIQVF